MNKKQKIIIIIGLIFFIISILYPPYSVKSIKENYPKNFVSYDQDIEFDFIITPEAVALNDGYGDNHYGRIERVREKNLYIQGSIILVEIVLTFGLWFLFKNKKV